MRSYVIAVVLLLALLACNSDKHETLTYLKRMKALMPAPSQDFDEASLSNLDSIVAPTGFYVQHERFRRAVAEYVALDKRIDQHMEKVGPLLPRYGYQSNAGCGGVAGAITHTFSSRDADMYLWYVYQVCQTRSLAEKTVLEKVFDWELVFREWGVE